MAIIEKNKSAKVFVCHHPALLFLYKNLSKIIKKYSDARIILIKVNHPYFFKFNFEPYKKNFDNVFELDFVHYKRNVIKSYFEIINFIKRIKLIKKYLNDNFSKTDLFLDNTAWLPVNLILSNLRDVSSVTRFVFREQNKDGLKVNKIKTFILNLYTVFLKRYEIKVVDTDNGKFFNLFYNDKIPGEIIRFGPKNEIESSQIKSLIFPFFSDTIHNSQKSIIIVFGDAKAYQDFPECFDNYEDYLKKTTQFFKVLCQKYPNCDLYYKPHPSDCGKVMKGVDAKKYNILGDTLNSETIFDAKYQNIKAVYTLFSTSVISSSFIGIPSYTFYRYVSSKIGKENFAKIFEQKGVESQYLFHIANLNDIGKIDNIKKMQTLDLNDISKEYLKILKI